MKIRILVLTFILCFLTIGCGSNNENVDPKWYESNKLIAHAGGGIQGLTYTNSIDAIEENYSKGHRIFECDLIMTSDNQIVLRHDWGNEFKDAFEQSDDWEGDIPTYDEYKESLIGGRYTVGTLDNLCQFMKENEDVYVVTDTKDAEPELVNTIFNTFWNYLVQNNLQNLKERFIIQIYTDEMLNIIDQITYFPNKIYTLYYRQALGENINWNEFAEFCVANNIDVVTLPANWVNNEVCEILSDNQLRVYTHTINRLVDYEYMKSLGAYGIYTDWLLPIDITF